MPRDERRHQQKLLKKRRKEKAKHKQRQMFRSALSAGSAVNAIRNARQYPILECLIGSTWREHGLANIVVARQQPNGLVTFGVYLVDLYCLGLKNAFCNGNMPMADYGEDFRANFTERNEDVVACDASLVYQIIYGAIDYAAKFEFKPHKDFALAQWVLDPRETVEFDLDIEFGKDGKPLYVSGPDDPVNRILNQLDRVVGKGNYNYMIGGPESDFMDDEDDDEFDDDDDDDDDEPEGWTSRR